MENLFNAIFIPSCMFCKSTGSVFCRKCLYKATVISEGFCVVCEKRSLDGRTHSTCLSLTTPRSVFSAFKYEGVVQGCIKKSKYGPKYFASLKRLIKEGVTYASKCGFNWDNSLVLPIPLNKKRYRERGFNQAELISNEISRQFNLNTDNSILIRQKETTVQFMASRVERFANLSNAFYVEPSKVKNLKILLVDDICTSGATLLEASKCLYNANCSEVHCFTLARRV